MTRHQEVGAHEVIRGSVGGSPASDGPVLINLVNANGDFGVIAKPIPW
jgi:hypothetical protein